jgi:hypothetical protein
MKGLCSVAPSSIHPPSHPCSNSSLHSSKLPFSSNLNRAILFAYQVADFKEPPMEWTTPQHEEIDLNCEISSYANAEL